MVQEKREKNIYVVYVYDCDDKFVVRAKNKKEAVEIIYKEIITYYPPERLRAKGCKPYYKKDIEPVLIEQELEEGGLYCIGI